MKYGDLGKRFVASLIDGIITFVIGLVCGLIPLIGPVIAFFAGWMYVVLQEGGNWHATVGKRIMGLYIAYESGEGISYGTSILRQLSKYLSGVILCIGYIMCLFNREKQCLHDMIAKTYVLDGYAENVRVRGKNVVKVDNSENVNAVVNNGVYPELVAISGPLAGSIYDVTERGILIGRDSVSCQVVLPESQGNVSRVHCHLTFNPISGMFVLNDRGSTHGTFLANGVRVQPSKPVAIKSGERFYLATPDVSFEVR